MNSSAVTVDMGTTLDLSGATSQVDMNNLSGAGSFIGTSQGVALIQSSDAEFTGVISGDGASIYLYGGSTLTLTNTNTLSGTFQINNGTLALSGSGGVADCAYMTLETDGILDTSGVTLEGGTFVNNLNGSGAVHTGSTSIFGAVSTNPQTYSGDITGSAQFILQGTSTLTLSGFGNTTAAEPNSKAEFLASHLMFWEIPLEPSRFLEDRSWPPAPLSSKAAVQSPPRVHRPPSQSAMERPLRFLKQSLTASRKAASPLQAMEQAYSC